MARKSTPQPLTLPDPTVVDDEQDFIDSPRSPLSPKSPKSPRSAFRFNTKKTQSEQPHMQAAESQTRATIPTCQTNFSLNAILPYSGDSEFGGQESQENQRPSRSGFFSNYKASKSSSRLQNSDTARQAPEDSMSRDTDRPAMSGKVSTKETARTGTTFIVSSILLRNVPTNYFTNRIQYGESERYHEAPCRWIFAIRRPSRRPNRTSPFIQHDYPQKEQAKAVQLIIEDEIDPR
jgi:hypothetical protein